MKHICGLCNSTFNRKEHLTRHMNKLRQCNNETNFECEWCCKSFTVNSSLTRHIAKCKAKQHHDVLEMKAQITDEKVEVLETKCKLLEDKINLPNPQVSNSAVATINGNSNTTTNNNTIKSNNTITHAKITINNYGSEDMVHMNLKRITFVFSKSFNSVVACVRLKHFSPLAPQNKNVCIKDIKSKYAYVFCDGNWDVIGRKKLIDEMYIDICDYIEEKLDEFIDELDEHIIIHIKRFLEKKNHEKTEKNIKTELTAIIFNTH